LKEVPPEKQIESWDCEIRKKSIKEVFRNKKNYLFWKETVRKVKLGEKNEDKQVVNYCIALGCVFYDVRRLRPRS
jgi:hypothetical protein